MRQLVVARRDALLKAHIVRHTPLYYRGGDEANDRPAFVRAGSSLTRFSEWVVVVQDDANFIALIDTQQRTARSLALPAGRDGERVFDRQHGNQDQKLDLEACVTIPTGDGPLLLALGSGSKPPRERIIAVRPGQGDDEPSVEVYDGAHFYALLRDTPAFSGCELNVEGAAWLGDGTIRLFQRGNGEARNGLEPVDATCDVQWPALWAHLQDRDTAPPAITNIVEYRLGELDGRRLNFSDAEEAPGAVLFSASCEDGEGGQDGAIGGSALGIIDNSGARWTQLFLDGAEFREKIEGLSVDPQDPYRILFVVDDDNDAPSELFEVELSGPWYDSSDE